MGNEFTNYKKSYNKDNYSRITLYFPKNDKIAIDEYCKENNIAVAEFIKGLVYDKIGNIIKSNTPPEENKKIEIFYVLPDIMIFTCGNKWMKSGPDERGYKFGMNIYYAKLDRLKAKFSERQIDEKTFNRWEKMFSSSDSEFKYGDDYNGDIEKLISNLKLPGDFYKIYDNSKSFPSGE